MGVLAAAPRGSTQVPGGLTGVNAELEKKQHRSHPLSPASHVSPQALARMMLLLRFHHLSLPFLIGKTIKCKHALNILFTD